MKESKYSDAQTMAILKPTENGVPVSDLCREHGMSSASHVPGIVTFVEADAIG